MNEDGSFNVEIELEPEEQGEVETLLYGVPPEEVSFDDVATWGSVFGRVTGGEAGFTYAHFSNMLAGLGGRLTAEETRALWLRSCAHLFGMHEAEAADSALDVEQAYRVVRRVGLCAGALQKDLDRGEEAVPYHVLYMNGIRMGGRDPSGVSRTVTLEDAFAALGLSAVGSDAESLDDLANVEQRCGIRLPDALKSFFGQCGVCRAVRETHPNDPKLSRVDWLLWPENDRARPRRIPELGLNGDCAMLLVDEHDGDYAWHAVFCEGDLDARVYLRDEQEERWHLVAPTMAFFFWDLAQSGLIRYQEPRFAGMRPVRKNDIGLIYDRPIRRRDASKVEKERAARSLVEPVTDPEKPRRPWWKIW
ncbi:SMI1/KNR4 family protein [Polyangium jinanense]|uniref:SMI1/KNR4 family protein n=1 Tax=Polyangium jinanense TaxID=2829994 RepID=A0A9X3XEP7_9BACT|nr:SMI1/KNR4 family protein [Polyangium jinanense]MDC3962066.1 SMI1/KNR4 family protein [Polyangium jinanense]MDC3988782.1 SMI1/KNR4 family protein [Polyangium jinanense]